MVARIGAAADTRRCSTGSFSNMSGGRVSCPNASTNRIILVKARAYSFSSPVSVVMSMTQCGALSLNSSVATDF